MIALVWTDVGKDLGSGPKGPWQGDRSQNTPKKPPFFPTIQLFPQGATDEPIAAFNIPEADQARGPFAQSVSPLAQCYGQTLDPSLMAVDSFYAQSELFIISASSICQQLNLIESIIDDKIGYKLYESQDYSLADLSYHQDILRRLEPRLRENITVLEQSQSTAWPRMYHEADASCADEMKAKAAATANLLLADFKHLLLRVDSLSARCQNGMSICMNSAAIAESQRAIAQARQVEQLTRLAFIYVPLSFTTSFFGMNLSLFGTGNPVWRVGAG